MRPAKEYIDILLVTGGQNENKSAAENINKLICILLNITDNIHLITFCNNEMISALDDKNISSLRNHGNRFKQFLHSQLSISKEFYLLSKTANIRMVIFTFGSDLQLFPLILAKMAGKKIVIRSDGRPTEIIQKYLQTDWKIKKFFFKIIEEINYNFADMVLTECEYMIIDNNFEKYNSNIGNLFVDMSKFENKIGINHRKYDVGYIGRLSDEKGVMNLVETIPNISNEFSNMAFLIVGEGELQKEIENIIREKSLNEVITQIGWLSHEDLSNYLNCLKLLVVPSKKEGLPNIVLEAMACGTLVLATDVGGIPGVIKDGETGFIMENNSPACIAENMMRALEHPNLEMIVENARVLVEREFAYEVTVEKWEKILEEL